MCFGGQPSTTPILIWAWLEHDWYLLPVHFSCWIANCCCEGCKWQQCKYIWEQRFKALDVLAWKEAGSCYKVLRLWERLETEKCAQDTAFVHTIDFFRIVLIYNLWLPSVRAKVRLERDWSEREGRWVLEVCRRSRYPGPCRGQSCSSSHREIQRSDSEGWDLMTLVMERGSAKWRKIWSEGLSCGHRLSRTNRADGCQALNWAQILSTILHMTEVAHWKCVRKCDVKSTFWPDPEQTLILSTRMCSILDLERGHRSGRRIQCFSIDLKKTWRGGATIVLLNAALLSRL